MVEYLIQDTTLFNIAQAIRNKTGKTDLIPAINMSSEIELISGAMEDISTEEELTSKLVSSNIGKIYRYTGTTTNKYVPGDIYIVEANS